jgi:hypothetical protein
MWVLSHHTSKIGVGHGCNHKLMWVLSHHTSKIGVGHGCNHKLMWVLSHHTSKIGVGHGCNHRRTYVGHRRVFGIPKFVFNPIKILFFDTYL